MLLCSHFENKVIIDLSFVDIDREIFSMVIHSLPLIQEGQLSVSVKRICTNTGKPLEVKPA